MWKREKRSFSQIVSAISHFVAKIFSSRRRLRPPLLQLWVAAIHLLPFSKECSSVPIGKRPCVHADTGALMVETSPYIKSFGLRAVLPDFSQYAMWRNLPFSKTERILMGPPQRLIIALVPSRRAFFDTLPAISVSLHTIDSMAITIPTWAILVKPFTKKMRMCCLAVSPSVHYIHEITCVVSAPALPHPRLPLQRVARPLLRLFLPLPPLLLDLHGRGGESPWDLQGVRDGIGQDLSLQPLVYGGK